MKDYLISRAEEANGAILQTPTNYPRRILVVDDDSDLRLLYADVLVRPDYQVDAAEDGAAGWEALRAKRYDLLIIDNDIRELTGIELVKKLRSARMALPVVMATGRLPTCELARNPSLQPAVMLLKPFAVNELLDTVETVLCAAESLREQLDPLPNRQSQPSAVGLRLIETGHFSPAQIGLRTRPICTGRRNL
jgi:DNA-binding response OmpR family regulator